MTDGPIFSSTLQVTPDGRLMSHAASRNLGPIQQQLDPNLPHSGRALEIASGTGEHIAAHARRFPALTWTASDVSEDRLRSIDAWRQHSNLSNLTPPLHLNACNRGWARDHAPWDVILIVNLLHLISEIDMAQLIDEIAQATAPNGLVAIYGPFLRDGKTTSPGDAAFHRAIQQDDPDKGYKDIKTLMGVFEILQFRVELHEMPANNLFLLARKTP